MGYLGRAAADAAEAVLAVPVHQSPRVGENGTLGAREIRPDLTEILEGTGLADIRVLVGILDVRDVDGEIGDAVVDPPKRREAAGLQKIPRLGQRPQHRPLVLDVDELPAAHDGPDPGLLPLPAGVEPAAVETTP